MKALFSGDEFKVSAIALCMLSLVAIAIWKYHNTGSIGTDISDLIKSAFYSLTGLNVLGKASDAVSNYGANTSTSTATVTTNTKQPVDEVTMPTNTNSPV